jgi:hypothetical protein
MTITKFLDYYGLNHYLFDYMKIINSEFNIVKGNFKI